MSKHRIGNEVYDIPYNEITTYKEANKFLKWAFGKNWDEKINLETFDVFNGDTCVLGQLYGGWLHAQLEYFDSELMVFSGVAFGSESAINWKAKILKRREKRKAREKEEKIND